MSHELRTPLNAVLGFSEVLLERMFGDINETPGGVPPRHPRLRQAPAGAAQRDPRPVQGRGRPDGAGVLRRSTCRAVLEYAVSMLRERAAAHGDRRSGRGRRRRRTRCTPTSSASSRSCSTWYQRGQVHRRRRLRGRARAATARTRSRSRSTDTGIGVPEADRERIFESFQQGGRGARARRAPASGSPCRAGSWSCSAAGCGSRARSASGSTFGFSFPVRRARERGAGRRRVPTGMRPRVVVIEDDRPSLDLFTAYLSGAAITVDHGARRPVRPRGRPARPTRPPCCSTSGCPASTAGRCCGR